MSTCDSALLCDPVSAPSSDPDAAPACDQDSARVVTEAEVEPCMVLLPDGTALLVLPRLASPHLASSILSSFPPGHALCLFPSTDPHPSSSSSSSPSTSSSSPNPTSISPPPSSSSTSTSPRPPLGGSSCSSSSSKGGAKSAWASTDFPPPFLHEVLASPCSEAPLFPLAPDSALQPGKVYIVSKVEADISPSMCPKGRPQGTDHTLWPYSMEMRGMREEERGKGDRSPLPLVTLPHAQHHSLCLPASLSAGDGSPTSSTSAMVEWGEEEEEEAGDNPLQRRHTNPHPRPERRVTLEKQILVHQHQLKRTATHTSAQRPAAAPLPSEAPGHTRSPSFGVKERWPSRFSIDKGLPQPCPPRSPQLGTGSGNASSSSSSTSTRPAHLLSPQSLPSPPLPGILPRIGALVPPCSSPFLPSHSPPPHCLPSQGGSLHRCGAYASLFQHDFMSPSGLPAPGESPDDCLKEKTAAKCPDLRCSRSVHFRPDFSLLDDFVSQGPASSPHPGAAGAKHESVKVTCMSTERGLPSEDPQHPYNSSETDAPTEQVVAPAASESYVKSSMPTLAPFAPATPIPSPCAFPRRNQGTRSAFRIASWLKHRCWRRQPQEKRACLNAISAPCLELPEEDAQEMMGF